jgi:hypothetical protein
MASIALGSAPNLDPNQYSVSPMCLSAKIHGSVVIFYSAEVHGAFPVECSTFMDFIYLTSFQPQVLIICSDYKGPNLYILSVLNIRPYKILLPDFNSALCAHLSVLFRQVLEQNLTRWVKE